MWLPSIYYDFIGRQVLADRRLCSLSLIIRPTILSILLQPPQGSLQATPVACNTLEPPVQQAILGTCFVGMITNIACFNAELWRICRGLNYCRPTCRLFQKWKSVTRKCENCCKWPRSPLRSIHCSHSERLRGKQRYLRFSTIILRGKAHLIISLVSPTGVCRQRSLNKISPLWFCLWLCQRQFSYSFLVLSDLLSRCPFMSFFVFINWLFPPRYHQVFWLVGL